MISVGNEPSLIPANGSRPSTKLRVAGETPAYRGRDVRAPEPK